MPRFNFGSEREICEQMAAECEAAWITSEYLFTSDIHDQILGDNWRERIENLAFDVRNFGSRVRADNGGLLYDFS